MQVKELMSDKPQYLSKQDTVQKAAQIMKKLDCGFVPVGDNDRLNGVVTDRDIVLRCVAEGNNPAHAECGDIISNKVLYCFEDDDVEIVAQNMG